MEAKTPLAQDKHFWLSVGGVISILLAKYLKIEIDPATLATIGGIIIGYITNSKIKEARVATAILENPQTAPPAAPGAALSGVK
jgi:hypothetical protein